MQCHINGGTHNLYGQLLRLSVGCVCMRDDLGGRFVCGRRKGNLYGGSVGLLPFYCAWVIVCKARLETAPISKGGCKEGGGVCTKKRASDRQTVR